MIFPILHIPVLGDGMTIALDAVLHVLISHGLAIGAVSMVVLFQALAAAGRGAFWSDLGRSLLGPLVIATTSVGAVTGVGIWFITGALAPAGIGSLIHLFFWPWFIEWGAFTAEVVLLLFYYYLWPRLSEERPKALLALGIGYVCMAVLSGILISGILGFMLTPDGWPSGQRFVEAYFNPTFIPQCFLRIFGGLAMGALVALAWTAWTFKGADDERRRALRLCGVVAIVAAAVSGAAGVVYFQRVPQTYLTHWVFAVATSVLSQRPEVLTWLNAGAGAVLLLAALAGVAGRKTASRVLAIPALILCVGLVSEFERVREFVRGPYLLPGYMYANQIPLVQKLAAEKTGMLPELRWVREAREAAPAARSGRALFDADCGVCHSIGGVNDIRQRIAGRTLEGVNALVGITQQMVPFMTPFSGTDAERLTLATYLYALANTNSRPAPQLLLPKKPAAKPAAAAATQGGAKAKEMKQ
ncbi:MAG: cytochrome C [Desulfovibrionaceae bacterium CG1_02_65_16]|nr:MAG: cytochrome C [Desulfovibrionaceae bacterium CG1_02_65_16]